MKCVSLYVAMQEQWAAVKQLGVQCLAQGHFNMNYGEIGD